MNQMLGAPVYTKPTVYMGLKVPEVLMSGNHAEIKKARQTEAIRRSQQRRPDLLEKADLADEELKIVKRLRREEREEEENE